MTTRTLTSFLRSHSSFLARVAAVRTALEQTVLVCPDADCDDIIAFLNGLQAVLDIQSARCPKIPNLPKIERKERIQFKPKDFTKPKVKKPAREPACNKVLGYFGCWDYPNKDWERKPTEADIPEIMAQKQQRYPGNELWVSEEKMRKWFVAKGWLTSAQVQAISQAE